MVNNHNNGVQKNPTTKNKKELEYKTRTSAFTQQ
jgi:hypothetical protein